ncbi:MAG: hypothetical protein M3R38_07055 [Actinomycetota bacterium]|nr:hypothetical protein [Actinomycetota bacterium]
MKGLFIMAGMLVMTLIVATPALTRDMPDLDSAEELPPPNTDYQITDDGYLIEEGDIVFFCKDLEFPNYDVKQYESYPPESQAKIRQRYREEYDALVKACTEAGFPPASETATLQTPLPKTGGPPLLLLSGALLVGGGLLIRTAAFR